MMKIFTTLHVEIARSKMLDTIIGSGDNYFIEANK